MSPLLLTNQHLNYQVLKDSNRVQIWERDNVGEEVTNNLIELFYSEEKVILSAGQTIVTFINPRNQFYVGPQTKEGGRLFEGDDYSIINGKTIELVESFDAGTVILGQSVFADVTDRNFDTLTGFIDAESLNVSTDKAVRFSGYDAIGDGGGSEWAFNGVTGQTPSQAPTQLLLGLFNDINGNQWKYTGNTVSFRALGGVGDGSTDDSDAIEATLQQAALINGIVAMGAGDWKLTRLITITGDYFIKMKGNDANEASTLKLTDLNSGIKFAINNWHQGNITLSGFHIFGGHNGELINPAIEIDYANFAQSSFSFPGPKIKDITYHRNVTAEIGDSIIKVNNGSHAVFTRLYFNSNSLKGIGIRFTGDSIAVKGTDSYFNNLNKAISVEGTSEGGEFVDINAVNNNYGISYNTDTQQPGGLVLGCHLNNWIGNVETFNRAQIVISSCLFYRKIGGTVDFNDVLFGAGSLTGTVSDCIHATGSGSGVSTGVNCLDGSGYMITGNRIRARDRGIVIDAGVGNCLVSDNNTKTLAEPIVNDSGNLTNVIANGEYQGAFYTLKLSTQAITEVTTEAAVWDSVIETNIAEDLFNVGQPTRLVAPPGTSTIKLSGNIVFESSINGYRELQIFKNGANFSGSPKVTIQAAPGGSTNVNIESGFINVLPADYFELMVKYSNGGSPLNISASNSTWFTMNVIG